MNNIGFCKYCGNSRIVKLEGEEPVTTQAMLDIMAAEQCDCEEACHQRKKEADRETASAYIDNVVDKEALAAALKNFIEVLQDYKAQSISVKVDNKTKISLSVGQDGALSVQRVDTMKTVYDTE